MGQTEIIELSVVAGVAIFVVLATILVLRKGRAYQALSPESRPRRWVLFSFLVLFVLFLVWFPVWLLWPKALVARVLGVLFAATFLVVTLTFKRFSKVVDWYIQRRGWPLR
jgi:hypothetical protein